MYVDAAYASNSQYTVQYKPRLKEQQCVLMFFIRSKLQRF
jgi:hypothetical protein